ncbi:hypothetical protein [uncultured Pseudodesulfovibrio sp.]|uniref:hypothetical protein n=1 Tax=uncultured Pseudodesulfovibrio sp. TaxID=2035858 RepID=UPI0029C99B85|nr:hypothetical protein [uncultured Pseudodesulfovibrio sp.]
MLPNLLSILLPGLPMSIPSSMWKNSRTMVCGVSLADAETAHLVGPERIGLPSRLDQRY